MASVYDIELDQGSDAVIPFELYDASDNPLDLSGYTARMQIRPSVGSATISDELTTENGRQRSRHRGHEDWQGRHYGSWCSRSGHDVLEGHGFY